VTLPTNTLIPRLPNRLNYLHLLQDISLALTLKNNFPEISSSDDPKIAITDIGAGASNVYSLLGQKLLPKANFIAVEPDLDNFKSALSNVKENNLGQNISVVHCKFQDFKINFEDSQEQEKTQEKAQKCSISNLNLTICNPPFFNKISTDYKNRSGRRRKRSHKGVVQEFYGKDTELETENSDKDEFDFIKEIIEWSSMSSTSSAIFSSMMGKKSTLLALVDYFQNQKEFSFTHETLKQGKTHRWVIFWWPSDSSHHTNSISANTQKLLKIKNSDKRIFKKIYEIFKNKFEILETRLRLNSDREMMFCFRFFDENFKIGHFGWFSVSSKIDDQNCRVPVLFIFSITHTHANTPILPCVNTNTTNNTSLKRRDLVFFRSNFFRKFFKKYRKISKIFSDIKIFRKFSSFSSKFL